MKEPLLFRKLLNYWTTVPKMLDAGIADGHASREPMSGFVPLKGLSPISDLLPPQAYAHPAWADVYNWEIMKFRKCEAFSAFWSGMSKSELEARLETYAQLTAALAGQPSPRSPLPFSSSGAAEYTASNEVGADVWLP
jgi:hypothetical protein